jgi:hypothetical protein
MVGVLHTAAPEGAITAFPDLVEPAGFGSLGMVYDFQIIAPSDALSA